MTQFLSSFISLCLPFILISTRIVGQSIQLEQNDQKSMQASRVAEGVDSLLTIPAYGEIATVSPSPYSGPSSLAFLKGQCFSATMEKFEYQLCPFHNVTQRRLMAQSWQMLGVWGKWKHGLERDIGGTMLYSSENACAGDERSVEVRIHCLPPSSYPPSSPSTSDFLIGAVDESEACRHIIDFKTPLPCVLFKEIASSLSTSANGGIGLDSHNTPESSSTRELDETIGEPPTPSLLLTEGLPSITFADANMRSSHFFPISINAPLLHSKNSPTTSPSLSSPSPQSSSHPSAEERDGSCGPSILLLALKIEALEKSIEELRNTINRGLGTTCQ